MPFGSNIQMYAVVVDEHGEYADHTGINCVPVDVPSADPPWWWSEYLTEEWKRKNKISKEPTRDERTRLQRAEQQFAASERLQNARFDQPTEAPRHEVWK